MNNPQFYIFGVPDGFDMYNATPEKVKFFQLMYNDQCHDNRRMVIHRNADNSEVTYIYLRYNMRSYSNRPSSFLGLALTFSGGYFCKDMSLLLNLFEIIYKGLSSDVVLSTKIPSGQGQGRYMVRRFAERTEAIIKTEEFVESQTKGWFGQSIVPMDETFILVNQSTVMKNVLSLDTKPEHIIANMKTASWVYLSDRTDSNTDDSDGERQRQLTELKKIKADFERERDSYYTYTNKKILNDKRQTFEALQRRLNALSIVKTTTDGNQMNSLIDEEINSINNRIYQIEHGNDKTPLQVEKPGNLDGERQRQLAELRNINAEFERERDSYYKYTSKKKLSEKRQTFETLRERLNALSIVKTTTDGVRMNSLIAEEINNINNRIYQIEQSTKTKKWLLGGGGVGVALLVAFLVFFSPQKEPPTPTDYGWSEYSEETWTIIEKIQDSINTRKNETIPQYSSDYSTNIYYEKASNILNRAKKEIDSAESCLTTFDEVQEKDSLMVVYKEEMINDYIKESRKELSGFEKAWDLFKGDLKKQEDSKKKEAEKKQVEKGKKQQQTDQRSDTDPQSWNIKVTGNPNPQVTSDGINTWHVYSGTNNPVTIKVTNKNNPVDVVWMWNDATVAIQSKNVQSAKTECSSIRVTLKGGKIKGKMQFKLKNDDEFKYTIWLESY